MSKRKAVGADSSGASQLAAAGAKQSCASRSAASQEPRLEVRRRANVTHMVCATLGCGRQAASLRASFCRPCFLETARANSLKRQSFRGGRGGGGVVGNKGGRGVVGNKGGRGVVGNKGNTTAGQSKVNAAEKRKSFKGNTETGQSKRSAGKRSGLKRSAKHALVVKKRWLDKILDGEKDWEIRSSRTRHRGWVHFAQSGSTGKLMGRARLVGCHQLLSDEEFESHVHRHCVVKRSSVPYKKVFAWVLEQAERFEKPFAYAHRPGAVVWVNVR